MFWLNYKASYYIKPWKWNTFDEGKRWALYDYICLLNTLLKFFDLFYEEAVAVRTRCALASDHDTLTWREKKYSGGKMWRV